MKLSDFAARHCLFSIDTEFIDTGKEIHFLSIGLVRQDGAEIYFENAEFDPGLANAWSQEHVLPKTFLGRGLKDHRILPVAEIAAQVFDFLRSGDRPASVWAHYASYDWVVLCQLAGRMIDLPNDLPRYVHDFKVAGDFTDVKLPKQAEAGAHHALVDARWGKLAFAALGIGFAGYDQERDIILPEICAAA